jgi:hypothetical protein
MLGRKETSTFATSREGKPALQTSVHRTANGSKEPFMSNAAQSLNDRYDRKGMIAQG